MVEDTAWKRVEEDGSRDEEDGMGDVGAWEGRRELTQCGTSGQDSLAGSSTLDHDTPLPVVVL